MTYTIEQFLAAAEAAEVSMIDAQHICDTLVKMNEQIGKFRRVHTQWFFNEGEIIQLIEQDQKYHNIYLGKNKEGSMIWIPISKTEPTTETF